MINLLDKFLTLLIDVIHSMAWAFKNNYLFEAWRNIEWGGINAPSMKAMLCTQSIAEHLDEAKRLYLKEMEIAHIKWRDK